MRKITSLLILSLFLISAIPVAFAEEGRVEATAETELRPISVRAEVKADVRARTSLDQETRNKMMERREEVKGRIVDLRNQRVELRQELKLKLEEKRKAYLEGKNELRLEFKDRLRACKGDETANCKEVRSEAKTEAQATLLHAIDRMLAHIDAIQERVENSKLSTKAELLATLEADEQKVLDIQTKVEALGENATAEELRMYSQELKTLWKNIHQNLRIGMSVGANFGVHGVIVRAEKLETRLETVIAELKEQGEDTTIATEATASFKVHVAKAKDISSQADAKFKAALEANEGKEALVKEGHDLLKQARDELRMAHEDLKKAVRAIKALKNGATTLAEQTATVEAEAQAELSVTA